MHPGAEVEPFITVVRRGFVLGPSQGRFGDANKRQIVNILVYNFPTYEEYEEYNEYLMRVVNVIK